MFHTVFIAGLGLIGASLVRDIRTHKLAERLVGVDPDPRAGAALEPLLDAYYPEASQAMGRRCDLAIIATPPGAFEATAKALAPHLAEGALVMDTGSIKRRAIAAIAPQLPGPACFIPAHPIAGSEKSGAGAGQAGLFLHRRIVLTPYREDWGAALTQATQFWQAVGGVCEVMDPEQHDRIYAMVSHLPQCVAYAAASVLSDSLSEPPEALRSFLRLSGSSPMLWRDIIAANRDAVGEALEVFQGVLAHISGELTGADAQTSSQQADAETQARLFARIVASVLVSAVTLGEKQMAMKLAPYAGSGFADMTAILQTPPEGDLEQISRYFAGIIPLLDALHKALRQVRETLEGDEVDAAALETLFTQARDSLYAIRRR